MTTLPSLLIMKLLALAGEEADNDEGSMSGWNVFERVYLVVTSVCLALNQGFLPTASYAVSRKDTERVRRLTGWALVLGVVWAVLCGVVVEVAAKELAEVFGAERGTWRCAWRCSGSGSRRCGRTSQRCY
jgi:Na+-driven multidrug efflux pump